MKCKRYYVSWSTGWDMAVTRCFSTPEERDRFIKERIPQRKISIWES